jgi:hypothetical protein
MIGHSNPSHSRPIAEARNLGRPSPGRERATGNERRHLCARPARVAAKRPRGV